MSAAQPQRPVLTVYRRPVLVESGTPAARHRVPLWVMVTGLLVLVVAVLAGLVTLGSAALPTREGPPIETLAVERTTLAPGVINVTVRNTGPDPVQVAQVAVNDAYVDFGGGAAPIERLQSEVLTLQVPWQTGQPYTVAMLTSTGVVIEHTVEAAVATPPVGIGLVATMALLGTYVGIIPVALGMLALPLLRRLGGGVIRVLLGVTVGLLAFLAVDAAIEGFELGAAAGNAFGGPVLVVLGAGLAFVALTVVNRALDRRTDEVRGAGHRARLALMIAVGIGLHNLGEGLAIGSAYAVGELALGAALVAGFALHNTTEGLAVVAPMAHSRPRVTTLLGLGLIAGGPAIVGAMIGVGIDNAALSAVLFGVGVGAILQVLVTIAPGLRNRATAALDAPVLAGIAGGVAVMYLTGLLVTG